MVAGEVVLGKIENSCLASLLGLFLYFFTISLWCFFFASRPLGGLKSIASPWYG